MEGIPYFRDKHLANLENRVQLVSIDSLIWYIVVCQFLWPGDVHRGKNSSLARTLIVWEDHFGGTQEVSELFLGFLGNPGPDVYTLFSRPEAAPSTSFWPCWTTCPRRPRRPRRPHLPARRTAARPTRRTRPICHRRRRKGGALTSL